MVLKISSFAFMNKDYYKILGISKNASEEDIRKAFHNLAHKHHPDKGGDEKKFKEINEAYQTLSNKEKRAQYDKFGSVFEGGAGFEPGFDFSSAWGRAGGDFEFDFGDLSEMMEDFFGFGAPRRPKDLKRGRDIEVKIEVSLEEVFKGKEKEINLEKLIACSRCQGTGAEPGTAVNECFSCRGTGQVQQIRRTFFGSFSRVAICPECGGEGFRPEKPCNVCKGEGRIKGKEKIKVFIPAGADTNQLIKIERKGEAGRRKGRPGDLYVRIFVKPHPLFKRKGDDLFLSVPVSFSQAALGEEIEISTLDDLASSSQGGKKILLKVPAGTESGKILRISGKGIPHFSSYGRGNLYVELVVKTPKKLTKKQKELLEKLKAEGM
jgi:molecular chaperone DnaJ